MNTKTPTTATAERPIHKRNPARRIDESGMYTQEGEPLFRLDIHRDLRTVTIEKSDHREEPYAAWRGDVLSVEPMTLTQIGDLEAALKLARQRAAVNLVGVARAAVAGGAE